MRKLLPAVLFALAVGTGTAQADVVVRIAPPHAFVEHRGKAPSRNHIWVDGYHRWDGHRYVWTGGRWVVPPHPHARWVAPKWNHRHNEYVFSEGHWR